MSKRAVTAHPVHDLIATRWSPYGFATRAVDSAVLQSLFEAARWAPSSYNEQPWRYLVATKDDSAEFEKLAACLMDANRAWASAAPVLALGVASMHFARNNKPNAAALHDLGQAAAYLTLEATARGLFVHQMIGIHPERVRSTYEIPAGYEPLTALAIGHLGDLATLPEAMQERDRATRTRKPLAEIVFQGRWGAGATKITG